jgi:hypothetical protein
MPKSCSTELNGTIFEVDMLLQFANPIDNDSLSCEWEIYGRIEVIATA